MNKNHFFKHSFFYIAFFSSIFLTNITLIAQEQKSLIAVTNAPTNNANSGVRQYPDAYSNSGNGGVYYGAGGVYLAPEQNIDPSETQFNEGYNWQIEHPPQEP